MILFICFLALFFGLNLIGGNLVFFLITSIIAFFFIFYRFSKKYAIIFAFVFLFGLAFSFFNLKLNPVSGQYSGIVIETKANYYIIYSNFERFIVYEDNNAKEVGDIISIDGNIADLIDTSLESEFSFTNFLLNKGITRQIYVTNESFIFRNFIRLKAFKNYFLSLFDENARDYIDAFLFNVKNYDNDAISALSSLNISHLFSSSGIYLSLLFKGVEYLLFIKFDNKKSRIFSLILLSWHLIFAFNRAGIRRVTYMKIFSLINEYKLKKRFSYLELVSLNNIIMLVFNRYLARQSSFYLGAFLALALYFSRSALKNKKKRFINKTSIFLFLFMLPVSLFSNHEFHPLALIFQIIVMPFSFFFYLSGVVAFYTYPIRPYFSFLALNLSNLIKGISYIDIVLPFKSFSSLFLFLYYASLFFIIYSLEAHSYKKATSGLVFIAILFTFKIVPYEYLYADSITFLNVGQGDSAIVRHKDKTIMIDTGGLTYKDIATSVSVPYLRSKGIYKLDYVFISHSDYDHSGALTSLKNNFDVKEVIDTSSPFKISIMDLEIENINKWADLYSDTNDKSQVLRFKVANKRVLMMGDASVKIEKHLIDEYQSQDFTFDIVKLGHHGSNTSSSYEFLKFIKPKEAIISVGKNNKYHHPSSSVITSLKTLHIPYYRTDEVGSVSYYNNSFLRA